MEINELRIGSIISDKEETGLVDALLKEGAISTTIGTGHIAEFKPTPISEVWLLKLGFEQYNKKFSIKTGFYYNSNQDQKQTSLKIKHTQADNFFVQSPGNGSIYIKHVHQLQNLYFALTGKELIIK